MSDSAANILANAGTAWHVKGTTIINQIGWISGSGSPVGSVTPTFTGQEYFDSTNFNWWRSYGTGNTQWVELGGETEAIAGPTTITAANANALAVGANGATNPVFQINSATASVATGISITGAAAGSGVAEQVISSGTNENFTINAKGSGTLSLNNTATGAVSLAAGGGGVTIGAGSATVAPLTLSSGTVLTAAAAGAIEFDGNAFYATAVASSRQQIDAEQYIIATANSATYNNAGLDSNSAYQVFTSTTNSALSSGAVTVQNGKTYAFEFQYMLTNTGTTSHTWAVALGGNASFATGSGYGATGVTGTSASTPASGSLTGFINSTTLSTAVVVTAAQTSATEQVTVSGSGVLVIGSSGGGTVIPQMKASARPGATGTPGVTILAGSFFRIWEMGTNTQVGDWS